MYRVGVVGLFEFELGLTLAFCSLSGAYLRPSILGSRCTQRPLSFEQKEGVPLLSGKRFRFTRSVVGIQLVNGTAMLAAIPANSTIEVLSGPNENGKVHDKGLVYVLWQDKTVAMFAVDVQARGVEVEAQGNNGHKPKGATA